MKIEGAIEKFALSIAIGSLLMLGVFLIVDATVEDFLEDFEGTVASEAWPVVVAIPAVTLAYIVGAFTQVLADQVVAFVTKKAQREEWTALQRVAESESDLLTAHFEEIRGAKKLLEGSLVPLVLIAVGLWLEQNRLPRLATFLVYASVGLIALAAVVPLVTGRLHKSLVETGKLAKRLNAPGTGGSANSTAPD